VRGGRAGDLSSVRVLDLMSRPALTVGRETPLREVASFLSDHHISGAPVVDDDGRLLGVVSESDIVEKERGLDEDAGLLHRLGARFRASHADPAAAAATTAGEAMTSPPITTQPTTSDYGAVWLMSEYDIDRLPVLDRGELVGVITRADLTREFARADTRIAADIRSSVLEALALPEVAVIVREGRVRLDGVVDRRSDRQCLAHAVSQVPGVVSVDLHVVERTT
jgi:CBS domain-containing protein